MNKLSEVKTSHPAPKCIPCANVQPKQDIICKKSGKHMCSACRLVSYCSKDCQKAHWYRHKLDCQNPMRSEDWQPSWIKTGRIPSFMTENEWGNTPATDMVNHAYNEKDANKDFALAFIASGDLRHVLRSLNELPPDYSGKLNILLNDINIPIVCRNIVLLLVLGNVSDPAEAADIALHFWYSLFMPSEYRMQITCILNTFLCEYIASDGSPTRLGPHSTFSLCITGGLNEFFQHYISSSFSIQDAQDEYNRVRNAPSRLDYRDRMYAGLKPSHRVAFERYRRFGILLPFGAMNAHFNCPNNSLFSLEGKWWQTDYADPLEGWDIAAIITVGKRYGATAEDIYGCLYFFLSEQLRIFIRRLRTTATTFTAFCMDACDIPKHIQNGLFSDLNFPASSRFDRIVVSNIFDVNYVGIEGVLRPWSPLLAETKNAAIVGYFMNWFLFQKDGLDLSVMMFLSMADADALYENSRSFSKFLQTQGISGILQKTKLRLREKHRIVPQRILAPLQGPTNALPEFPDDDTWYHYTKLTCFSWAERFVEFERAN
ncbi:hypothetical protein CPB83DRAFT_871582 [Crepidotus variabilis]|uniref:MYND-type domain-containing protein n=1 Tax=Crepidotus variabilis TaxID=179855 RepID=A0A9P6E6V1_9AGAR|nr:hypothetical protein CPB83DRAFT_871582 [Crepidotus variabilis]